MKVHSFESMAALDGEGIRFAVFFTRCPLRCVYCHNPDTWCTEGTEYTAEQLYKKIRRYKPYFKDNGGVTFSGGEPLLNASGINEVYSYLKEDGISYVLDTSGAVRLNDDVREAVDNASMVICDLKFWDDEYYLKYTGKSMENTRAFLEYVQNSGCRLWIRTVIVPGLNDSKECIDKYIAYIKTIKNVEKYELLGFHTMGFFKYDELGIDNPLKDTAALLPERLAWLQEYADKKLKE